ncbi:hypothetical protein J2T57_003574 [Natronocella acetinitrilica]|uniref:Uncharacterized protein n=1 Tax=Natronocella acetinitrilica TaxID=414046 RepID=A0AAE3KDK3_9GAMM|nr:hypothetical protein [Natronocella acetinitrilica]MCP1676413.1 hypothetical protein [Natronocella acetinitrilica]
MNSPGVHDEGLLRAQAPALGIGSPGTGGAGSSAAFQASMDRMDAEGGPRAPGVPADDDRAAFDNAIRALEAQIANAGAHLALDSSTRAAYSRKVAELADELRGQAASGQITWRQAAEQATEARNLTMESMRWRSTPVGQAMAESLKSQGRTFNELIARKTQQLYGNNADFNRLTEAQRSAVYGEVVKSAGKSNPRIDAQMRNLSHAGRGLVGFSLALSAYTVMTAEDKGEAVRREAAITGGGVLGGLAGGAAAGLACGPGAPVCVGIGAFAGGAAAAFGVASFW